MKGEKVVQVAPNEYRYRGWSLTLVRKKVGVWPMRGWKYRAVSSNWDILYDELNKGNPEPSGFGDIRAMNAPRAEDVIRFRSGEHTGEGGKLGAVKEIIEAIDRHLEGVSK